MQTLWRDLRFAFRTLRKSPGFTIFAVLTLGLGIGANTAVFSVINGMLLRPLPYKDTGRLVTLAEHTAQLPGMSISYPNFLDWQQQNDVFEQVAAVQGANYNLTGVSRPERIRGRNVSANFFATLGVVPVLGRDFQPDDDRPQAAPAVIMTHSLWRDRFGSDLNVIGTVLRLNGLPHTVAGVLPEGFQFYLEGQLFVPIGLAADRMKERGQHPSIYAIARLKPNVTVERARAGMATVAARLAQAYPATNTGHSVEIVPLLDDFVGDTRRPLFVLFGAVGFVLLIACANVANLQLARASARQKELAIRCALGAGRRRILRQLFTESVLLAVAGGAAGVLFASWGVQLLAGSMPEQTRILRPVSIDGLVLAFSMGVSLLTGIVFGLAPALRASQPALAESLKDGGRGSSAGLARHRFRSVLVAVEVALSLVLLIGAGLMLLSFRNLRQVNPGFDSTRLLTAQVLLPAARYDKDEQVRDFYSRLLERVSALPGVESAGLITPLPFSGEGWQSDFYVEGSAQTRPGDLPNSDFHYVSETYLRTMRIPLLAGRHFAEADDGRAPLVAIVNQTLARRFWPGQDPIGKRFKKGGPDKGDWVTVVGVAGDVKQYGLDREQKIEIYVPARQSPLLYMTVVVRSAADPALLVSSLRGAVEGLDKDQPIYNVRSLEELVNRSLRSQRMTAALLGIFAGLAFVLAGIGIYGVVSYSVSQRSQEMGIRMALGAQKNDVLTLVFREGAVLAGLGVALGLLSSFGLTRVMDTLLFRVSAHDPAVFGAVAITLFSVAMLACYVPARRATRVNPIEALRCE